MFLDIGGARRDRTADLLHAMQALSQLSYGPNTYFVSNLLFISSCRSVTAGRILGTLPFYVNDFLRNLLGILSVCYIFKRFVYTLNNLFRFKQIKCHIQRR